MLKKSLFGMPTLIVGVMLVFGLMGCDNGTTGGNPDPDPQPTDPQSITYVSKDNSGNLYTLEITEDSSRTTRYATKQGDFFKLTVELYNDGNYTVALFYEGRIGNTTAKSATEIEMNISVNNKLLTITIIGTEMTLISGEIVNDNGAPVVETPETLSPVADKTALGTALAAANTAKEGVVVSANGADILTTAYWVTQGQMDSFTSAIAAAQAFYDEGDADQSMVNSARIALVAATTVFNGQKRLGTKTETSSPSGIYVAGNYTKTDGQPHAGYWHNTTWHSLEPSGAKMSLVGNGMSGGGIAVSNNDVYITGMYIDSSENEHIGYWINGSWNELFPPAGSLWASVSDIAVADSNVYVSGTFESSNVFHAGYWLNGNWHNLSDDVGSSASCIAASGNNFVVGGDVRDSEKATPSYWLNGNRTSISLGNTEYGNPVGGWINDIAIIGTNVHAVGTLNPNPGTTPYWENGTEQDIGITGSSLVRCITVSGSNIYIIAEYGAGDDYKQRLLRIGSTWSTISVPHDTTLIDDITVSNDAVYLIGNYTDYGTMAGENYKRTAYCWVNGTYSALPMPSGGASCWASAIEVLTE
jgi:hypothetical protein